MTAHPIFFDPTKRRAATLSLIGAIAAVVSTIVVVAFVASVLVVANVDGPAINSRQQRSPIQVANQIAKKRELLPVARQLASTVRAREAAFALSAHQRTMPRASSALRRNVHGLANRPLSIGFYVTWDDSSYASLKKVLPKLDWVVPSWVELTGPEMTLKYSLDRKSLDFMRQTKPEITILPMLQNATDGTWDGPGLARMLADPQQRQARLASPGRVPRIQLVAGRGRRFRGGAQRGSAQCHRLPRGDARALQAAWLAYGGGHSARRRRLAVRRVRQGRRFSDADGLRRALRGRRAGLHRVARLVCRDAEPAHEAARSGAHHRGHRQLRLRLGDKQAGRGRDLPGVRTGCARFRGDDHARPARRSIRTSTTATTMERSIRSGSSTP